MGSKRRTNSKSAPSEPREEHARAEFAARIEQFRQVGIRLDRAGSFWHRGDKIEHPRIQKALLKWLDVRPADQRPILRLDETRYAYLDVDDAMLLVESIRWDDDKPIASLNDGREQPLAVEHLYVGPDSALYTLVRDCKLSARLTQPAYYALAERIEESADGFALRANARLHMIGQIKAPAELHAL